MICTIAPYGLFALEFNVGSYHHLRLILFNPHLVFSVGMVTCDVGKAERIIISNDQ